MPTPAPTKRRLAAIVPCLNEEQSVGAVIRDLRAVAPEITVYVYDNGSTDNTVGIARAAGAEIRTESRRGKGFVVQRAFADIDADIYVMVDGDDTYDVSALPSMISELLAGPLDQVVGVRREVDQSAYRPGHVLGNRFFNGVVARIFGEPVQDMLTGFRVMSARFVKSFPARSRGFEIETELTIHAIGLRVPQSDYEVGFQDRAEGSESKLRTYHDGWRILRVIFRLARYERPKAFHVAIALMFFALGLSLGLPVGLEYLDTGLVRRFPTAILASSVMLIGFLALLLGYLLEAVRRVRDESARLAYLRLPAVEAGS